MDYGLQELVHLNYATYCNAQVARTMNKEEVLSHKTTVQENTRELHFSHHTAKTEYVNRLLKEGGSIPAQLLLYKMNITIVDTSLPHLNPESEGAEITIASFKHLRQVFKEIQEHQIKYWHELTDQNNKLLSLTELQHQKGLCIRNCNSLNAKWKQLCDTMTDNEGKLLPKFRAATSNITTMLLPSFSTTVMTIPSDSKIAI